MNHSIPTSGRKSISQWLITLMIVCLITTFVCCEILRSYFPATTRAPDQFLTTDIVFRAVGALGFVNADGSNIATIPFLPDASLSAWGQPLITGDNRTLIVTNSLIPVGIGNILVAHAGEDTMKCRQWGTSFVRLAADQEHIFIETKQGLAEYSPEDCGTDHAPAKVYNGIYGALSPNKQYSAEVRWVGENPNQPMVIVHEISTEVERTIGPGDFPAWSRDSQWLAYTGPDGIYIVNVETNQKPRRIIALSYPGNNGHPLYYEETPWYYPPEVSWSPDGQWLAYHVYGSSIPKQATISVEVYDIYKVHISTGEEVKLVSGGISPFWRWPVETP